MNWKREAFVCKALEDYLPVGREDANYIAVELQPGDGRYWAYLRPPESKWRLDRVIAVGSNIDDMDKGYLDSMYAQASGIGAKPEFIAWRTVTTPLGIAKGTVDIALLSEGAPERLGFKKDTAMKLLDQAVKPGGRLFIVATEEDEKKWGVRLDMGWDFPRGTVLSEMDFELAASQRDDVSQLVVAMLRKRRRRKPNVRLGAGNAQATKTARRRR